MSTKATIQTLINTNLADGSSITASEHRAVENSLLNELYPSNIYETQGSNTITTENTSNFGYQIHIIKQGRLVTITGLIINNNSFIVGNNIGNWFFEIVNSEFFQITSNPSAMGFLRGDDIYGGYVELRNNKLYCTFISGYSTLNFQLTYTTQN
jgi:hypothetical protein